MGLPRITAGALATLALAVYGGAARAGDAAAPRRAAAGCSGTPSELRQSMDGRISGCVRLGPVAPGPHTLVLEQILNDGPPITTPRGKRPLPRPLPRPMPPPFEPRVAVSLAPVSGGPGTVVTVTGRLRRPLGGRRFAYPNLCWAGCAHGLTYSGVGVRWISPRAFRARLLVPAAPWLMNGSFRLAPLVSGRYPIAVGCLRAGKGCESIVEGAATFTLRSAHPPAWCRTQASCAQLRVTPARALPGAVVRISGFAPLTSVTGSDQPFVDQTETLREGPRGPEVRFNVTDGLSQATFGRGALRVLAPVRYGALRDVRPIGQVTDGLTPIAADPATPAMVAWCTGVSIDVSANGSTTAVPTTAVAALLKQMGFSALGPQPPPCAAVAPIDSAAGAPVGLAAAFTVGLPPAVPPFYDAAVATYDGGRTWTPVPVPPGASSAGFGGFRYRGATLEAVFAGVTPGKAGHPQLNARRPRAELTSADGRGWTAAPAGCPAAGPCVSLAPFWPGNCAMNGSSQPVVRSTDGGRGWSELGFPPWVQACGQATLVALSPEQELLVDSTSSFPVLRTTDGGRTWHDVALPPRGGDGGGDLSVLPDGSLVMSHGAQYAGAWKLLRRGARAWCELTTPSAAVQRRFQLSAPTVIGGALWWLAAPAANPDAAPAVDQVPLTALAC